MLKILRTVTLLALVAYVVTSAVPMVQTHGLEHIDKIGTAARDNPLAASGLESAATVLSDIRGISIGAEGIAVDTASGRKLVADIDLTNIGRTLALPSGNGSADTFKYGAILVLLSRVVSPVLRVTRGFMGLFGRRTIDTPAS